VRARLTARHVFTRMLRAPAPGSRRLAPLTLYPAFGRVVDAWDARDEHGARYDELAFLAIKKSGKSTLGGGLVIADLIGAGPAAVESDREIYIIASDLAQARDIVFSSAARFVRRDPWLSKHVTIHRSELIYRQVVTDHRTGGRHVETHVAYAVPAKDARGLHGRNPVSVVFDETWTHAAYDVFEALAPSPARAVSRRLYLSYAGLRSQQKEGVPLWDLWQRWQRGDDPRLFVSHIGGPEGWRQVPWITERAIETARRQFATVPSKFRRLYENAWVSGDEAAFLSDDEIQAAVDPALLVEPQRDEGCAIGIDLGLRNDYSAVAVCKVVGGKLTLLALRTWRGSPARPVSLGAVEEEVVDLAGRFGVTRIASDTWQAEYLVQRIRGRVPSARVTCVQITPALLDQYATSLKNLFSSHLIHVPPHPLLLEQLESLVGREQARRDLVRFIHAPGTHDDLIFALALAADALRGQVGRPRLPRGFTCWKAVNCAGFVRESCFLFRNGLYYPADPVCNHCAGFRAAKEMHVEFLRSRPAEWDDSDPPMRRDLSLRGFVRDVLHAPDPNVIDERRFAHVDI
jgi:hypothetical protein